MGSSESSTKPTLSTKNLFPSHVPILRQCFSEFSENGSVVSQRLKVHSSFAIHRLIVEIR